MGETNTAGTHEIEPAPGTTPNEGGEPPIYEIRVGGHLDPRWSAWFSDLAVTLEAGGNTCLRGAVIDQAALYSLLRKIRDVGLPLLSVIRVERN